MLTIRMQRTGKKNKPEFRLILAQKTSAASKKFIEVLGSYNPRTKELGIKDQERLSYWIAQHVNLSPTVHNLLVTKKLLEKPKVKSYSVPKKPAVEEKPAPQAVASEAPVETTPEPAAETPATEETQA